MCGDCRAKNVLVYLATDHKRNVVVDSVGRVGAMAPNARAKLSAGLCSGCEQFDARVSCAPYYARSKVTCVGNDVNRRTRLCPRQMTDGPMTLGEKERRINLFLDAYQVYIFEF